MTTRRRRTHPVLQRNARVARSSIFAAALKAAHRRGLSPRAAMQAAWKAVR